MNPTTAADRMLVSSNMIKSFDWMLTRDIRERVILGMRCVPSVRVVIGSED